MYHIRFFIIAILAYSSFSFCQADAGIQQTETIDSVVAKKDSLKYLKPAFNPKIAFASAVLIPGAGHFYTKHYIRAFIFPAAEVGVGLYGYNRYLMSKESAHKADSISNLATQFANIMNIDSSKAVRDTTYLATAFKLEANIKSFDKLQNQLIVQQCIMWMAGIYYYNIVDALHMTNVFVNDYKKDPSVAWKYGLIPFLGLGQLYNGELGKAGMISMVQLNLAFIVFNYQRLINECDRNILSKDMADYSVYAGKGYGNDWDFRKKDAFRNRNMYIWYTAGFYIYSILDAMVDAHLHDANIKMRIDPEIVPQSKQLGLTMTVPF